MTDPNVQTPPGRSSGAFRHAHDPQGVRALISGGVLGRNSLVPMQLDGIILVRRPEVSPEPHRLGLRGAALDDDPQRLRLGHDV